MSTERTGCKRGDLKSIGSDLGSSMISTMNGMACGYVDRLSRGNRKGVHAFPIHCAHDAYGILLMRTICGKSMQKR